MADKYDDFSLMELKNELDRMVQLFENTQINYQILDNQFNMRYVNTPWLKTLGYENNDIIGKPFRNVISEKSETKFEQVKQQIIDGECNGNIELYLKCKEGSELYVSFSCFQKFDNNGNLTDIHGVFQNITKLRKTEQALKASEDKYERIFKSITDIYYQTDKNSIIQLISPSVEKLGGYKPSELIGRSVSDFIANESDRKIFRKVLFKTGSVNDYDIKLVKKNGGIADVSLNAHFIRNVSGEVTGIEGVVRDISRRKSDEHKLRESELLYKTLAENSPDVIMRFDKSFRHIFVNSSVCNYVDVGSSDFIGKTHREMGFPTDNCLFWENSLKKVFNSGRKEQFNFSLRHDNKTFEFEWILVPEFGVEGKIETVLAISRDITERIKLQTDLDEYHQRLKEITDSLPVMLFKVKQHKNDLTLLYVSPNVTDIIGISDKEIISDLNSVLKRISPVDIKRIKNALSVALKEKKETSIEYQILIGGELHRWFRLKASPLICGPLDAVWYGMGWDITEEIQMKNQVREQAERLKDLYEFANVGIATMSTDGIITSVSPSVTTVSGYSQEELVGRKFSEVEIFQTRDYRLFLKLFKNALRGRLPGENVVFKWKPKNGEPRWGDAYLSALRVNGRIKGFQGIFMDATHRILHEESEKSKQKSIEFLFESAVSFLGIDTEEEFYRELSEKMKILIPGVIININSINEEQTLLKVESVTGLKGNIKKIILRLLDHHIVGRTFSINKNTFSFARHGKLMKEHNSLYDLTFHTIPERICSRIEKLIGLREILEISLGIETMIFGGCAIFITEGCTIENPGLIETLFKQATQALTRIKVNDQLRKKEALYRSLAENTKDLILRVNAELRPIYANNAFLNTFNLDEDIYLSAEPGNIGVPLAIRDIILKEINQALLTGKLLSCNTVINKDHSPVFLEWHIFPERNEKKEVHSVLLVVRDITERKRLESRIQDTIDLKNRMYSLIGHDLRSPFGGIIGMLDLLINDKKLSDRNRLTYLRYTYESSLKLNNLLNSLLEWSHEFEKEGNIKPIYFDLAQMLDNSIELFKLQIFEKKLTLHNSIPDQVIIRADYNMLFASFRNFISNACKFSRQYGKIDISSIDNDKTISVIIKDYGTGMTKNELKKLMSLDLRFTKQGTFNEVGNGLGFAFARELIELNNGKVLIESRPGIGSSVTVELKK
jgi:PAS domain S-box-containing protein